jgi:polyisoprenoid-binding protein YceI
MTAVRAAAATWRVDTARSAAGFRVANFGLRHVRGTVPVREGTVTTDADGAVRDLRAVLDATGVDTAHAHRDRDLRSARLLAVEQVPTWSFTTDEVTTDGAGWRVAGTLVVRRPCPVVLAVAAPQALPDGALRVRATTVLDRRDAGVRAPRVLVGRSVEVELDVVLVQDARDDVRGPA